MSVLAAPVHRPFRLALAAPPARGRALTWIAVATLTAGLYIAALVSRSPALFWVAAGVGAGATLLALRLQAGVCLLLLARPSLDVVADRPLVQVHGAALNAASVVALATIVVGAAYIAERWQRARRAPALLPFVAFALVAAASIAVAPSKGGALTEWLRLVSIVVLYALAYLAVERPRDVTSLVTAILVSAVTPVAVGAWQAAHGGAAAGIHEGRAAGTFLQPDPYGIYLAVVIALAAAVVLASRAGWRWLVLLALPVAAAALVGSYTRTAWIMVALALLALGAVRHRTLLVLVPLLVVAVAVAAPSTVSRFSDIAAPTANPYGPGNSLLSRLDLWRENLPKARRNPVLGLGLGAIVRESTDDMHVHSDYVRALVETGAFGLLAYTAVLVAAVAGCWRAFRASRRSGPPMLTAAALGGLAASLAFVLASGDSNLMTQVSVSGTAWGVMAAAHGAGRLAREAGAAAAARSPR